MCLSNQHNIKINKRRNIMWEVETTEATEATATMEINGDVVEIEVGANLKDIVIQFARDAGLGKFKFYINDVEFMPQNAPELIAAGNAYKIVAFDEAG
jgi:hypothetical protein